MKQDSRIYVAGHNGMLGSAIVRKLQSQGFKNLILAGRDKLDLRKISQVKEFLAATKPEYVILAAAKVGGINANMNFPVEFLQDNLLIQTHLISESYLNGVKKFVFVGSSCIYPKDCPQPMREEYLLDGKLEPTNEGYALAKITGYKLLEYYKRQYCFNSISLMPCNLYGPNDSFDLQHSHVLSALVRRFVDAKNSSAESITLWGTGVARREFMHVDDAAGAVTYFLKFHEDSEFLNIGWGKDISIMELSGLIAELVNYRGKILWDSTKPDGMLRKCMDVSKMESLGFKPSISIKQGIKEMIEMYKDQIKRAQV